jgi:hypothetical protein
MAQIPASLRDTAYMLGNNEIDSQESDLFEPLDDNNFVEDTVGNADGNIITNLTFITNDSTKKDVVAQDNEDNKEMAEKEDDVVVLLSPGKIIRKATKFAEIPQEPSEGQQEFIHGMLRKWANTQRDGAATTPSCIPGRLRGGIY